MHEKRFDAARAHHVDIHAHAKTHPGLRRIHRMMDEVYREMYRLEADHPGAEMGLALALLRAHVAAALTSEGHEDWEWLKTVSPICLEMIEESLQFDGALASMPRCSSASGRES